MGRKAQAKRAAKASRPSYGSGQPYTVHQGGQIPFGAFNVPMGREAEADGLLMLTRAWSRLPADAPTCSGPLLLHEDGNFECHGGHEESATRVRHEVGNADSGAVWPCNSPDVQLAEQRFTNCQRCASFGSVHGLTPTNF